MTRWTVALAQTAVKQLAAIKDRRIQQTIKKRLQQLENEPDKQGKALSGELIGYRSIRAVGQRYRIIYRLEAERVIVYVVAVGLRREGDRTDVYAEAERLLILGGLE